MNSIYKKAKGLFKIGGINWVEDNFKVALVSNTRDYGYQHQDSHTAMSDVPLTALAADAILETMVTGGAANGKPVTFKSVSSPVKGFIVSAIIIYKDTGNAETDLLIAYIDNASGSLPLFPNGGDVVINWDQGVNKIFQFPKAVLNKSEVTQ